MMMSSSRKNNEDILLSGGTSSSSSSSQGPIIHFTRRRLSRHVLLCFVSLSLISFVVFLSSSSSSRGGRRGEESSESRTKNDWIELKDEEESRYRATEISDEYDFNSKGKLKDRVSGAFSTSLSKEAESDLLMDLMGQKETRDAVLLHMNTNIDKEWKLRDEKRLRGEGPDGAWSQKPYEECDGENCPPKSENEKEQMKEEVDESKFSRYKERNQPAAKQEEVKTKSAVEEEKPRAKEPTKEELSFLGDEEKEEEKSPEEEIIQELEDIALEEEAKQEKLEEKREGAEVKVVAKEEGQKSEDEKAKEIIAEAAKSSIALIDEVDKMKKTSEVVVDVPTPSSSSSGSSGSSDSASISSSSITTTTTTTTTTTKEGNGEEVDWSKFSKHKERKQPEAKQEEEKKEEEKPSVLVEPVVEGRLAETVPEEDAKAGIFHEEHIVVAPREMAVATEDDHHKNMPENEYIAPISKRPEDNQLNEALAKRYSHENIVMVTWANNHYYDFVKNWVKHIRDCGMNNFLVGAMDNELLVRLIDDKVPTFAMQSGLTTADFGWGSKNFHQMGRKKIELIHLFTKMGFDILVSDVDTAWMKNPIPFIRKFPEVDVLTSSDSLSDFAETEWSLERTTTGMANIGIMLLRKSAGALAKEWVHVLEKDENIWDQNAFNDLMRKGRGKSFPDHSFEGYDGLRFGILPVATFASGHTFFVQRMYEKKKLEPYVVHATFQFSGTEGKRHRLREFKLWYDAPEYYDPEGGMLMVDLDVPEGLLTAAKETPEKHFDLVNHQLLQVRGALMLANSLKRTLILPEFWCGMDRWWAPHRGIIPGSQLQLPYKCPADHIFELETWVRRNEPFREYSILENPRTPDGVKNGVFDATDKLKSIPLEDFTDVKVLQALDDVRSSDKHKVLKFDGKKLMEKFSEKKLDYFADANVKREFENKIINYCSIWCCKHAHPGHIWYDMSLDVLPHKDRHGRTFNETYPWRALTGP